MKLKKYFDKHNVDLTAFAKAVGCSRRSLYNWIDGAQKPSLRFIKAIMKHTDGKVTANDFL